AERSEVVPVLVRRREVEPRGRDRADVLDDVDDVADLVRDRVALDLIAERLLPGLVAVVQDDRRRERGDRLVDVYVPVVEREVETAHRLVDDAARGGRSSLGVEVGVAADLGALLRAAERRVHGDAAGLALGLGGRGERPRGALQAGRLGITG